MGFFWFFGGVFFVVCLFVLFTVCEKGSSGRGSGGINESAESGVY